MDRVLPQIAKHVDCMSSHREPEGHQTNGQSGRQTTSRGRRHSLVVELLVPTGRLHVCFEREQSCQPPDPSLSNSSPETARTDVKTDEGGDELLDGERVERKRRSDDSLPVVAPRVASKREELDGETKTVSRRVRDRASDKEHD